MSLPHRHASPRGSFQGILPRQAEPDHTVVMPAITRLRAAGDDVFALEDAIDAIPHHIMPDVLAFATRRHEILSPAALDLLQSLVDMQTAVMKAGMGRSKVSRRGAATR